MILKAGAILDTLFWMFLMAKKIGFQKCGGIIKVESSKTNIKGPEL